MVTEVFPEYKLKSEYFFPISADSLFSSLAAESQLALSAITRTKRFYKGAPLFSKGESPRWIHILREGRARLFFSSEPRNIHIARWIEPNEILGLTENFAMIDYETGAEAVTSCLCECIERENFIRFLGSEPELCFRLAQRLGKNLQKSYQLFFSSIN